MGRSTHGGWKPGESGSEKRKTIGQFLPEPRCVVQGISARLSRDWVSSVQGESKWRPMSPRVVKGGRVWEEIARYNLQPLSRE
jgi:hypothetical protein